MTLERKIVGTQAVPLDGGARDENADFTNRFNFAALLQMLRVRQRIIVGTAAVVIALTAIYVFRETPEYDASSVVILDQRENKVADTDAVLTGLEGDDPTTIENQLEILRSRTLAGRVIDKLHLDQPDSAPPLPPSLFSQITYYLHPENWFAAPAEAPDPQQQAINRRNGLIDGVLGSENVMVVGLSSAMRITFRSTDPVRAATMANTIADAYVEDQLNAKFEATQKTSQWLADRLQQLSAQMQTANAAVAQYKAVHNITDTPGGGSILDQQLAQLNGQLVAARSDLAAAEASYAQVKSLQNSGRAEDVAQVFQSGLIGALSQQQADLLRQKAQLATTYGPRHPKMLDIESQIRNIGAKIDEEVKRVVETVANNVAVASTRVRSLEGSLSQLEGKNSTENQARVQLSELQARASSASQLYDAFLSKFKATQGQEAIQTPDARIISKAVTPSSPTVPNTTRDLELAAMAGLFLGLSLAWLAERLDAGFRTTAQIETLLDVPVLATLPELPGVERSHGQPADRILDKPLSSFSEAVRGLQMGLVLSNVDHRPKVVLVTSSVPDEGKTTVALSLARTIARGDQKVLLVDCDLRLPSVSKSLGISVQEKGLLDLLTGNAMLDECLTQDPRSSVQVLSASRVTAGSPTNLLGSVAMAALVDRLKSTFDMIVIDSAPLLPVHDTKMLLPLADAVLFAVRWEKTPRQAVMDAARVLSDCQAKVAGVVLTRADIERYRYYAHGYQAYGYYNKYYND